VLDTSQGFTYDARRMTSEESLLKTSLFELHQRLGARLIPFGGWLMPVQYSGIIAEHQAVRQAAGLFDLSHMGRLYFRGDAARALLQRITTNNIEALPPGRAQYNLICLPTGGILDDTVVYNLGSEFLLVVNASNRQKILNWLEQQSPSGASAVRDATLETAMIGLQGPEAEAVLRQLADLDLSSLRYYAAQAGRVANIDSLVARTGYTGEDGFELIVAAADGARLWEALSAQQSPVKSTACGLGARDTLRLEAGMPLYGHEITEHTTPFEAGLGRVVKLEKGDFIGREKLAELASQPPSRRLVGFQMVDNAVPRQGYAILASGEQVGAVTSGTFSPSLRRNLGMAYVPTELSEPGSEIEVVVRDRPHRATIVTLPHYPHRTRRFVKAG
jgi:aminomethyltransferase